MSKKQQFGIPKEIWQQPIEWLEGTPEIMEYLRKNGFKTVRDIIDRQKTIPEKYSLPIKKKIIFNIPIT